MVFKNRKEAGKLLTEKLTGIVKQPEKVENKEVIELLEKSKNLL